MKITYGKVLLGILLLFSTGLDVWYWISYGTPYENDSTFLTVYVGLTTFLLICGAVFGIIVLIISSWEKEIKF